MKKLILTPLAWLYAASGFLHRNIWLKPALQDRHHPLPMIVVGSLRAGGAGKTPVVQALAKHLSTRGLKVGILCYWLNKYNSDKWMEVTSRSNWQDCSDEAVLLARNTNCRVFVTRNRERAWDELNRLNQFDLLLSDDGLMDSRLKGAFRMILRMPGESPGISDLLPAGPYHLTAKILDEMDCVVEGPAPGAECGEFGVRRELIFPEGFDPLKSWWILCGLGNPDMFRTDLIRSGVRIAGMSRGPNHGVPDLKRAFSEAARASAGGFLCTAKDAIKLEVHAGEIESKFGVMVVVQEHIELGTGLIRTVERYLHLPPSS